MRPLRRAKLAMLGGTRLAQTFLGGNKGEENVVKPTKVNAKQAFQRGKSLMAAGQVSIEEQGSVGSTSSPTKATSIVAGALPVIAKQPVSQQDFIDALTAVMTGKVEFSDGDGADDDNDDEHSIKTVSTICSRVEVSSPTKTDEGNQVAVAGNQSLGIGQLFFYIDQKHPLRHLVEPLESASTPSNNQLALVPDSQGTYDVSTPSPSTPSKGQVQDVSSSSKSLKLSPAQAVEEDESDQHFGRSVSSIRSMIEAKAKEADRDGLFEKGCEMYQEGERLLYEGKIEEARDALQRAHSFQKRSLRLITSRMAETMHKQGLDHCDRGDKYLAVILLGVAEIIKHRPSAANIHMGAQVHRGYRRVCPKEQSYVAARREVDGFVKTIEREAIPMAKTLQTYSKALTMQ